MSSAYSLFWSKSIVIRSIWSPAHFKLTSQVLCCRTITLCVNYTLVCESSTQLFKLLTRSSDPLNGFFARSYKPPRQTSSLSREFQIHEEEVRWHFYSRKLFIKNLHKNKKSFNSISSPSTKEEQLSHYIQCRLHQHLLLDAIGCSARDQATCLSSSYEFHQSDSRDGYTGNLLVITISLFTGHRCVL